MKTKILSIITLFLFATSLVAQIDRSIQPKPGPSPKINLGKPQVFELKNGLKVLVVENHKLPRVSATLTLDNPLIFEGEKAGVSSLTGSLLGGGTKTISKDAFNEEVDYLGASISFSSQNASMSSLSKYYPRILELMANAALNPLFSQVEFDKEVNKLLDNIKSGEKSVENIASRVQNGLAYSKKHPYGEFASKESVEKVTLVDVQNFYNTYFKPTNAYLVIVGDVNFKDVKKLVTSQFSKWQNGVVPAYLNPSINNVSKTEINFIDMPNSVQSDVTVLNAVDFKMNDADYFAVLLANRIFGGDFNSHLNMNLREKHGYTYGARSGISADKNTFSVFSSGAQVRNAVTDSTVIEIMKELQQIRTVKVSEEELANVKAAYVGSFVRNIEKPQTVAGYALSIRTNNLPADFYETYLTKLNAVTIEDVQRVSQKYFSADNARIIVTGKALDVLPSLEKLPYKIVFYDKEGNVTAKPELTKPIPTGITKQVVFDNYIKAIGGADKVAKIKTVLSKAEATMQGMTLTMEIKSMAPTKQSVIVSGMGMVFSKMIFDGEKGYSEQQGAKKDLAGDELEKIKATSELFPELSYGKNDKVTLVNIEPINGNDAYVVKMGDDTTIYYDVKSGLKIKQVTEVKAMGQTMQQGMEFADFKEVNGVKFPHLYKMSAGPQQFDFITKELKINEGVTVTDFK
ncbi:pitrilysin family protein [Lutibacter sp.]|uniref:M16 family metallopeptidase n=1 Tax=Lutibacter sp. TaxID=1925666 RepID=UPI00273447A0|nr:pitrilysin family protein [Lutibacter sp.]MDP3312863.1 pitrilysin family protein [Lutibacter sp.]